MSLFTPEKQAEFIEEEIRAWIREDVDPTFKLAIQKRKAHIPSELESDISHDLEVGLGDALALYTLSFPDEGRHVDMRNLNFEKRPVQEGNNFILDWARRRGRSKFKRRVPGYKKTPKNLSEEKQIERIAAAIIASKPEKKHKRRGRWYNSTIQQLITRLTARISQNQSLWINGFSREQIEEAFTLRDKNISQRIRFK